MKNHGMNPYLPSWEYVPDGEPHVFGKRVYIYGSHDRFAGYAFCQNDYVCWSAPVDDLTDWQYEGIIYTRAEAAHNEDGRQCLYAPDVTCGPDGRYYLYYALNETSAISVAVCDTPAGKYTYYGDVHYPDGTTLGARPGDEQQFDPGVLTEGETTWLYSGFCPPMMPGRTGALCYRLASDMAAFVSGLLLIADMGHNCEKTLGFCKNQLDVPAALKLYNTKFFQNKLKTNQ